MEHIDDDVVVERRGSLGHILLNRPKVMNALTRDMANTIFTALEGWEHDDSVATILLSGAGERGLCAGGDIVGLYHDALAGGAGTRLFWRDEYRLNSRIASYPKPFVAFMDGVVLGGGIGLSAHANSRIVTERTRFGMPEVGIGFAPDVGGTWLLARAPGELGTHLGLTGGMGSAADAVEMGFADHFVSSDWLPALALALESNPARDAIAAVAEQAPPSPLAQEREWIDACYAGNDAKEIVRRLQESQLPVARETASVILSKSPLGVSVTLEALRRSRAMNSLTEVLNQDYVVSTHFLAGRELIEGIRAQVIDKDRSPDWLPATLSEVSREDIEAYFAPGEAGELGLSAR